MAQAQGFPGLDLFIPEAGMRGHHEHQVFRFKDKGALSEKIRELGLDILLSENIGILFEKVDVSGRTLPNRLAVHPMEGADADPEGAPTELTLRRYRKYASGGSGLIWFEATAVTGEGRSNPRQLLLTPRSLDGFKRLVEATRDSALQAWGKGRDLLLVLQLTHSGRFSRPEGKPAPVIAHHSPILDPLRQLPLDYPLITDDELDCLQEAFLSAAELASRAGFDGVDVKACHGYLVSELLAAFTRKDSRYGGSYENRTRFLIETSRKIRDSVPRIFITSRLNVTDGLAWPYGFGVSREDPEKEDLAETKMLVRKMAEIGAPLLNISAGIPQYLPHIGRPYDKPLEGAELPREHPLEGVSRLLRLTGELQQEFPSLPLVGTGYSWLRQLFPHAAVAQVKAGRVTLVGQGRGALAYPDSVRDLEEKGVLDPRKVCTTCSRCSQLLRDGGRVGCVKRDREIYRDELKRIRRERRKKKAGIHPEDGVNS